MSIVETDTIVDEETMPEPMIGARVFVLDDDEETELGYGTYMGRVPVSEVLAQCNDDEEIETDDPDLTDEETAIAEVMVQLVKDGDTTSKIVLESGETVYGLDCVWKVVEECTAIQ